MFRLTVIFFLLNFIASTHGSEVLSHQTHFRRLGSIATGLSYAHIHGTVDFKKMKTAFDSVVHYVKYRQTSSTSPEERSFIDALSPQLRSVERRIDDLQTLFFGQEVSNGRRKRQLFLGLAMALGVINAGTSIYTTVELTKLHSELADIRTSTTVGFKHVAHLLDEEDHAIHQLTQNILTIKDSCKFVLERMRHQNDQILALTNVVHLITLIRNMESELSAWGRGLESLTHGKLHPTLVNKDRLQRGLQDTVEKAKKMGLRPLHDDWTFIYKNPVSFISTKKMEIIIIIHLPLVEQAPLELYEYLPIPEKIGNIFVTIEATKPILASDVQGQYGRELSELELLKCQTEDLHSGRLFICPNSNLVENQIRRTCLGSLFFGHAREVQEKCLFFPKTMGTQEEFAKQIATNQMIFYTKENITVIENCRNTIRTVTNITGLSTISVEAGCTWTSERHTFKSPIAIDEDTEFVRRWIQIPRIPLLSDERVKEVENQLNNLKKMKTPNRIQLEELKKWIESKEREEFREKTGLSINVVTLVIGLTMIGVLVFLFVKYKRAHSNPQK